MERPAQADDPLAKPGQPEPAAVPLRAGRRLAARVADADRKHVAVEPALHGLAVAAGMGGSFVCLAALTVMKGLLERL